MTRPYRSALFLCLLLLVGSASAQPLRVVFDTDMGNDIDDALALAMLHAFQNRGEVELLAVTSTKDNRWSAPYIDAINTYYGRGDLPIGVVRDGKTPEGNAMIEVPASRRTSGGAYLHPHDLVDGRDAPGAVEVLRRVLAGEEDGAVTIVQVGFSTNLARLLDAPADSLSPLTGRELVARKVRLLVLMAGAFPSGGPEYNVEMDVPAARTVFTSWPTPIVTSGFEIGASILYPAYSIERHFGGPDRNPVADGYRHYLSMPYDRPTWDLTSVLYAVRPDEEYFGLSAPGRVAVHDDGRTTFEPDPDGRVRYLTVDEAGRLRAREAMIYLASEPPARP